MLKKLLAIPALALQATLLGSGLAPVAYMLSVGAPAYAQDTCGEVCTRDFWLNSSQVEIEAALSEVDVRSRNDFGGTPLHFAASRGTPASISVLLEAGANVNARDEHGYIPLHAASAYGTPENIVTLLRAGADLNARSETGDTPLHIAAGRNQVVFTVLGADGNAGNPLSNAPNTEMPQNIIILLEAGAIFNAQNERLETPLHSAVSRGTPEAVLILLEAGADGTLQDEDGHTPFDLAQHSGRLRGTHAYWALNDARFR